MCVLMCVCVCMCVFADTRDDDDVCLSMYVVDRAFVMCAGCVYVWRVRVGVCIVCVQMCVYSVVFFCTTVLFIIHTCIQSVGYGCTVWVLADGW